MDKLITELIMKYELRLQSKIADLKKYTEILNELNNDLDYTSEAKTRAFRIKYHKVDSEINMIKEFISELRELEGTNDNKEKEGK